MERKLAICGAHIETSTRMRSPITSIELCQLTSLGKGPKPNHYKWKNKNMLGTSRKLQSKCLWKEELNH